MRTRMRHTAWEDAILRAGVDTVAAVISEPIVSSAGGALMSPKGYFETLRKICDKLHVLLIVDEVITGLGRTGSRFACADEGVVPDLVLTGKGTSAGYTPMASVIIRERVVDALRAALGLHTAAHELRAVGLQADPDDQQLLADRRLQGFEKFDDLEALDRAVEQAKVESPVADPGNHRELLPAEAVLQHRSLTLRSTGSRATRSLGQT